MNFFFLNVHFFNFKKDDSERLEARMNFRFNSTNKVWYSRHSQQKNNMSKNYLQ